VRDLLALQRLSEMVETAVRHAVAAQSVPMAEELAGVESQPVLDLSAAEVSPDESAENAIGSDLAALTLGNETNSPPLELENTVVEKTELERAELQKADSQGAGLDKTGSEPAVKNPLFWSATTPTPTNPGRSDDVGGSIAVPTQLRDLQRCKACGFPVSRGRTLCVECEEKQLRGEQLPQPIAKADASELPRQRPPIQEAAVIPAAGDARVISALKGSSSADSTSGVASPVLASSASTTKPGLGESAITAPVIDDLADIAPQNGLEDVPLSDNSTLFLSSAAPSESWLAANKYVLGVLLVVAIVIGLIVWLR
jgi:hypothetical protein